MKSKLIGDLFNWPKYYYSDFLLIKMNNQILGSSKQIKSNKNETTCSGGFDRIWFQYDGFLWQCIISPWNGISDLFHYNLLDMKE